MIVDHLSYTLSMLQVYGCCIFLVFVLPMLMWRRYLRDKSLTERFLFCLITQTFFYVNVVLLLGFLNICNRWTLMGATFSNACARAARLCGWCCGGSRLGIPFCGRSEPASGRG